MWRDERKVVVRGPACSASAVTGWFSQDFSSNVNGTAPASASTARPSEVDVHGFAFNSSVLWDPERWGRYPTSEPDKSQVSRRNHPFTHLLTIQTCMCCTLMYLQQRYVAVCDVSKKPKAECN